MIELGLFQHRIDRLGRRRGRLFFLRGQRILARDIGWFRSNGINDRVSSFRLTSTDTETTPTTLFLYQHSEFRGRYLARSIEPGAEQEVDIGELRDVRLNDQASAVVLLRRCQNECTLLPINLTREIPARIRPFFEGFDLHRIEVSLDNFPDFAPNRQLVRVRVVIGIHIPTIIIRDRRIRVDSWVSFQPTVDGTTVRGRIVNIRVSARPRLGRRIVERRARELVNRMRDMLTSRDLFAGSFGFLRDHGLQIEETYLVQAASAGLLRRSAWHGETDDDPVFLLTCLDEPFRF